MPEFVIVGTARSGTTLVQRLACELPGVHVPPETHLLSDLLPHLERHGPRFPLEGTDLLEALRWYGDRPYLRGVSFDPVAVAAALGHRCDTGHELYLAVVRHLGGGADIVGEKTPQHLMWWEPLTRALPHLRVVIVVRDPRGVSASFRAAGWGGPPALNAQRWRADVRAVRRAQTTLGARCLLLRYEDVVEDPDATRERLRAHLGAGPGLVEPDRQLFPDWESWKADAVGPIALERAERWRSQLDDRAQRVTEAVCRRGMRWLGYAPVPSAPSAWTTELALPPRVQLSRVKRSALRWRAEREVRRIARSWHPAPDA